KARAEIATALHATKNTQLDAELRVLSAACSGGWPTERSVTLTGKVSPRLALFPRLETGTSLARRRAETGGGVVYPVEDFVERARRATRSSTALDRDRYPDRSAAPHRLHSRVPDRRAAAALY